MDNKTTEKDFRISATTVLIIGAVCWITMLIVHYFAKEALGQMFGALLTGLGHLLFPGFIS